MLGPDLVIIRVNPAFKGWCAQSVPAALSSCFGEEADCVAIQSAAKTLSLATPYSEIDLAGSPVSKVSIRALYHDQEKLTGYRLLLTTNALIDADYLAGLEQREFYYKTILEFLPVTVALRDIHTRKHLLLNRPTRTDKTAADYIGRTFYDLMPEAQAKKLTVFDDEAAASPGIVKSIEFSSERPTGTHVLHQRVCTAPGADGTPAFILVHIEDVTDRWRTSKDLRLSEVSLKHSQKMAKIGSWRWRVGKRTLECSEQIYALWGLNSGETETSYRIFFTQVDVNDRRQVQKMIADTVRDGESRGAEFKLHRPNAGAIQVRINVELEAHADSSSTVLLGTCQDITWQVEAEAKIRELALKDPLTGLPNRARFKQRLRSELARTSENGSMLAVHCLDLNAFKSVNDTFGHAAGDELLIQVASRLTANIRKGDMVARLGGDEFAVVQSNLASKDQVEEMASRLVRVLKEPYQVDGRALPSSASIGIALSLIHSDSDDELMRFADAALYQTKSSGRSSFQFFSARLQQEIQWRRKIDTALHTALENGEFSLVYQPQYCLQTEKLIGAEALIRWQHPDLGNIPPDQFIRIAEENGEILAIGKFVLFEACLEARRWLDETGQVLRVSVNLSTVQLAYDDLCVTVLEALNAAGMPASCLELEITETMMMEEKDRALKTLRELREMGVSLALDDFGTGYSSLAYMGAFALDRLKIDRSFIAELTVSDDQEMLVQTILSLGHALGLKVVAEGVENAEQRARLLELNCDEVQGFFFAKPLPAKLFRARLHEMVAT